LVAIFLFGRQKARYGGVGHHGDLVQDMEFTFFMETKVLRVTQSYFLLLLKL
jgi:hypothetical protein